MELEEVWEIVRSIPAGRVACYGDVGAALSHPTSGFQVGRWMARCPEGLPWWRVVSKQGRFPIGKIDPRMQMEQRELLEREGVEFDGDAVDMSRFRHVP